MDPVTTTASKQRNETLNKLLAQTDDGTVTVDDQKQRIKIAFAEGYLAANTEDKLGIAAKFLKVNELCDTNHELTIVLLIIIECFDDFLSFRRSFHKSYRWHYS